MTHRITLIPGDGIGPEITKATLRVLDAAERKINRLRVQVIRTGHNGRESGQRR